MSKFSRFEADPDVGWADTETCLELFRAAQSEGVRIKQEETTQIWRVPSPDGQALYVKTYCVPLRRRLFAGLARSRALREWRALRAMQATGLPVPPPVWFAESRHRGVLDFSVVATRALGPVTPLPQSLALGSESEAAIGDAVGRVTRRMHDAGFGHFRLRPKNVLVGPAPGFAIHLLDLPYTCHWPAGAPAQIRCMDLEQLAGAHARLSQTATEAIVSGYAGAARDLAVLGRYRPGSRSRWGQKLRRVIYFVGASWRGQHP